jgi:hypothetical protein
MASTDLHAPRRSALREGVVTSYQTPGTRRARVCFKYAA